MKKLKKYGFKFFLCLFTGAVIGVIAGVTGLNILVSYRIDTYHQKIKQPETVIEDKDTRLKKLEESMDKINKNRPILKDVEIVLEYEGDEIDKITLEKHIRDKFNPLLGKEAEDIDLEIVAEIIDKRIFKVDDREYRLKVTKIMLSGSLKVWVKVEGK